MSLDERTFAASVDAFRRATARAADAGATRARVLVAAGQRARRRAVMRRATLALAVVLAAALSGSAAWTALGRWRVAHGPEPAHVSLVPVARPARIAIRADDRATSASTAVVAPVLAASAPSRRDDGEARAYGRAHAAHFESDDPHRALALWDAYLRGYPTGAFAPEALFNRALCLVRLGRREEALDALRPFVAGAYGGYRQREAETLNDWIATTRE